MNIKFDGELVYSDNDKYIKTKIETYGEKAHNNFQCDIIAKENASYKCLSLIMLDPVIRANKRYYPQTHLEECKCKTTRNKVKNLINDDFDLSSSQELDSEFDNGSDNGSDNDESND